MCSREGVQLQRGMNFWENREYSVLLMSVRPNAPYRDNIADNGSTLIYEGHDVPRSQSVLDPKKVDQPQFTETGKPTENGRFHEAVRRFKSGQTSARLVRVYEKIRAGIWTYNGLFRLVDAWIENDGTRNVFKFKLTLDETPEPETSYNFDLTHKRIIPSTVKQEVWKRDGGKCRICGATENLHFDHIIPYSKGGSSLVAENIQLLCAKHNLGYDHKIAWRSSRTMKHDSFDPSQPLLALWQVTVSGRIGAKRAKRGRSRYSVELPNLEKKDKIT